MAASAAAALLVGTAARAQEERVGYTPEGAYDAAAAAPSIMMFEADATSTDPVAEALDVDPSLLVSTSFGASDLNGRAIMTTAAVGFPTRGSSYLALSSGCANQALTPNSSTGLTCDLFGLNNSGGWDLVQLTLVVSVPSWARSWALDWKMMSEEYPEWVGTAYNDTFLVEVGTSDFTISNFVVTAPNNVVHDADGALVSINTTGVLGMTPAAAAGTTYDGATQTLTTAASVPDGATTLTLVVSVMDVGDHVLDTTVFLDAFRFSANDVGEPITEPSDTLKVELGGNGTARVEGSGIDCSRAAGVNTGACTVNLLPGTQVSLSHDPALDPFSDFLGWKVPYCSVNACDGDDPEWIPPDFAYVADPFELTMNGDAVASAACSSQALTVKASGLLSTYGSWAVTGASDGVALRWGGGATSCTLGSLACTAGSAAGRTWTLYPPQGGTSGQFLGWSGACTGTGPCVVTMNAAKTVTAKFGSGPVQPPASYALDVAVDGPAGTSVSGDHGFVPPSTSFPAYTFVTLTADPPPAGFYFDAWTGCSTVDHTVSPPSCGVVMAADASVTATYLPFFLLTLSVDGTAPGTVTIKRGTTVVGSCSAPQCVVEAKQGEPLSLHASSSEAAAVVWGGACADGTSVDLPAVCWLPMTEPWSVTASFR